MAHGVSITIATPAAEPQLSIWSAVVLSKG